MEMSSCLPANTPDYQAAIDEEKVAQRLALLNNIDEVIL